MMLFSPALLERLVQVQAFAASKRVSCYLVGGLLRDQLLGRAPRHLNVDLAVPKDALALSRALAAHVSGAFVPLD